MFGTSIARAVGSKSKSSSTSGLTTSQLVQNLTSGPGAVRLVPHVKSLQLQLDPKPRQRGERDFVKNVLPRLAFANPNLKIQISHYERLRKDKKKGGPSSSQDSSAADVSSATASSPATSAAAEANAAAVAEAGLERPTESRESYLTIEFANIPARKVLLTGRDSSVITKEILDAARSPDQSDLNIPRPIGYDPVAEAAKLKAAEEAAARLVESSKSSTALYADEAEVEQVEAGVEPSVMSSAEGLSDVDGVAEVSEKAR
ncbi:unnamed protein product [Sympodiomycopsis kandeliae]